MFVTVTSCMLCSACMRSCVHAPITFEKVDLFMNFDMNALPQEATVL